MPDGPSIERLIGERLRGFRLRCGFTQRALARHVAGGIDLSYIGRIERGGQLPSLKVLHKLSGALGVSLREFFDFEAPAGFPEAGGVQGTLWRYLQRVPRSDLQILLAIARTLAGRRREMARVKTSGLAGRMAAEPRRRYRAKRGAQRAGR